MLFQSFKHIFILRKTMLWCVALLSVFTFGAYVFFVHGTISNIILRQEAESDMVALTSSIGDLESRYDTLRNAMTHEHARELGFGEPYKKIFVSKKSFAQEHMISF